jgi:ribose transport system substrate-binding protein
MNKVKIIIIFVVSILLLVIIGCERKEDSKDDKPVVALVLKTLNNPFFIDMEKGANETAGKVGIELIVQAAEREVDVEKQMQIIENLIQRKVDAICVTPSGSKEIIPAILKANDAGIPVLAIDTRIDTVALSESGGYVATFIGSDNYEGGKIAGQHIKQMLNGRGKVAILEGIPGHETGDARLAGFHEVIDQEPEIEVVASLTANWERDQGFNVFQNILQANPDVQALFACSDMMALGAIEAIAAAGKTGEIIVVGFDAVKDGRDAILMGTMNASVAQHPSEMGKLSVENAIKLINGESIPEYIPVKIELITKNKLTNN